MNINYKKLPKVNLHKSEEDDGRSQTFSTMVNEVPKGEEDVFFAAAIFRD